MKAVDRGVLLQRRQAIRLWFEFLKLAHADPRPEVKVALAAHEQYYKPWGDYQEVRFDRWWTNHSGLFTESDQLEVLSEAPIALKPNHIYLAIPLGRSLTKTVADIRPLLDRALRAQQVTQRKHKTKFAALYRLTDGAEVRVGTLQADLVVYRDVYLKAPEPRRINEAMLGRVHAYYEGRRRSTRIPSQFGSASDLKRRADAALESHIRTLRRSIKRSEALVLNAARGNFPGPRA